MGNLPPARKSPATSAPMSTARAGFFEFATGTKAVADFSDEHSDDSYTWKIQYRALPLGSPIFEDAGNVTIGGISKLLSKAPVDRGTPVLAGCSFHWMDGDHNVDHIQVKLFMVDNYPYWQAVFEDASYLLPLPSVHTR